MCGCMCGRRTTLTVSLQTSASHWVGEVENTIQGCASFCFCPWKSRHPSSPPFPLGLADAGFTPSAIDPQGSGALALSGYKQPLLRTELPFSQAFAVPWTINFTATNRGALRLCFSHHQSLLPPNSIQAFQCIRCTHVLLWSLLFSL